MDDKKLTERSRRLIQAAQIMAQERDHQRFVPDHLLRAMIDDDSGLVPNLIRQAGGDLAVVGKECDANLARQPKVTGASDRIYIDKNMHKVLTEAERIANAANDRFVPVEALLLALAKIESDARSALRAGNVAADQLKAAIDRVRMGRTVDTETADEGYDALNRFSRDLTADAREGKIDPIIGRDDEIRRSMQVLTRRTKNNPVLIGEPGCRQDGHRRGTGPADRQRRRARQSRGQETHGARHGGSRCGCQVSRRVRREAEVGSLRGDGERRQDPAVHRRNAHARRGRQG